MESHIAMVPQKGLLFAWTDFISQAKGAQGNTHPANTSLLQHTEQKSDIGFLIILTHELLQ